VFVTYPTILFIRWGLLKINHNKWIYLEQCCRSVRSTKIIVASITLHLWAIYGNCASCLVLEDVVDFNLPGEKAKVISIWVSWLVQYCLYFDIDHSCFVLYQLLYQSTLLSLSPHPPIPKGFLTIHASWKASVDKHMWSYTYMTYTFKYTACDIINLQLQLLCSIK